MDRDLPRLTVVTGAGGWLGAALTSARAGRRERLRLNVLREDEGERLAALAPHAEIVAGDLACAGTAERLLEGAGGADVLHAAGVIHPPTVADFERVNVGGIRAVLEASRAAGVRRLVHVSSNSPFGFNPMPEDVFRAEEPYHPYMGYGRSKMLAEQLVLAAHGNGLETTVVRPPWFYGPHQPPRQSRFFTAVRTGRFPLVGDGRNRRSMVHVDNLVDGLVRAELTTSAAGRAYWIADRRPYPMREVIETVQEALRLEGFDVAGRVPRLPRLAATLAERLDGLLQARGRYVQELHVMGEMDKTIACSIERAERELGYNPRIELLDGMRDAIRWCRAQGIEL
jgi:nucleoside-diphosphate-sugar epimerase